jgi:hypothetical protein
MIYDLIRGIVALESRVRRGAGRPAIAGAWERRLTPECDNDAMCRNIRTLANFAPPATDDEIRASALQFVRKLSGMHRPSRANQDTFDRAVEDVTRAARQLVHSIATNAPPRKREEEARTVEGRRRRRFPGTPGADTTPA